MRIFITSLLFILSSILCFSQSEISGDRLLSLVGKSVSDPLYLNVKQQESFLYSDAWNTSFNLYFSIKDNYIQELEVENGKLRYGSKAERYGYYTKPLPFHLNWNMQLADFEQALGKSVQRSESMNFNDFIKNEWRIRIFFENKKPVSISFSKPFNPVAAPMVVNATKPVQLQPVGSGSWIIKLDAAGNAEVNWPSLKQLIISTTNFKAFAGKDSVDYIGQVYYNTAWKVEGFSRTAIKRIKENGKWYYEAFFKIEADSNRAGKLFVSLYDALKKTIKDNTDNDFILAAVAKKYLSESPVNWLAQWSLYSNYKTLPAALPKVKIGLLLSGMKDAFKNNQMEYTFKIYIVDSDVKYDFFTWDKPL